MVTGEGEDALTCDILSPWHGPLYAKQLHPSAAVQDVCAGNFIKGHGQHDVVVAKVYGLPFSELAQLLSRFYSVGDVA